ncbi:MAG: cell division protein FtsZ [Alphaproteobacteria bacterium]
MTLNISMAVPIQDLKPRIVVIGVGGAGGNAVENMIRSELEGVEFVVSNTDAQALTLSSAPKKIQLGLTVTQGLGAGSRPEVGRAAAEEGLDQIIDHLQGAHMVFITAGMGGGTGTGAAPVIARAAREMGVLTVGVITKPFHFEGAHRMRLAEQGIQELSLYVDTLIIIPNQNLFRVANEKTTFADAFKMADDVLYCGVRGVTDLMVMPGLINLDFADIRAVMAEMGKAMMGTGEAEGERRALDAAEAAISNPLLEDISMKGARGVLINVTGGLDMTLFEVDEAANRIRDEVDPEANIIFGSTFDENLEGVMRVSVVATGIDIDQMSMPKPGQPVLIAEGGRRVPRSGGSASAPAAEAAPAAAPVAAAPAEPITVPVIEAAPTVAASYATLGMSAVRETDSTPPSIPLMAAADTFVSVTEEIEPEAPMEVPEAAAPEPARTRVADRAPAPQASPSLPASQPAAAAPATQAVKGDAFIPPRPIEPSARRTAQPAVADPFAAADVMNAGPAPEKPKRRTGMAGLFGRVTGTGHRRTQAQEAPKAQAVPAQATLGGLDPKERVKVSEPDDDLLDIPAFLRRQAN